MLNFFKRKPDEATPSKKPAPSRPATARPRPTRSAAAGLPPEPPPLPDVKEGNLESDWAMWEDSVAFQDSQMPSSFSELESVKDRAQVRKDERPDLYASVRSRRK